MIIPQPNFRLQVVLTTLKINQWDKITTLPSNGIRHTDGLYQDMRMHMRYTVCMSRKPVQVDIKEICTSMFPKNQKIMYMRY